MQTLGHLHLAAHLVHMDLHPGNIIMQHPEVCKREWDQLRLIDFGLSKTSSPGKSCVTGELYQDNDEQYFIQPCRAFD